MKNDFLKRKILFLLRNLDCFDSKHIYHPPNERNPAGSGWFFEKSCDVKFKKKLYGIRLCQINLKSPVQLFIARIEGREGGQNNYHLSFSSIHFDEYGILFVSPSCKRFRNKTLKIEPKTIGCYPAKVSRSKSKFLVGRIDGKLFPRLFALIDAKFDAL